MIADNKNPNPNSPSCECQAQSIVLLPCSGASNCGQITNHAAVKLTEAGVGKIYCLAGLGAHIEGMVESAKSADRIVALDGCPTACAKKTTEHAGIKVTDWICVTQEGIKKVHNFDIKPEEINLIINQTKELLSKK